MRNQCIDPSAELIVTPYKSGVKFLAPANSDSIGSYSLGSVMQLPCNFYLLNKNSECVMANKHMADSLELDSEKKILGKTVFDFCDSEESLQVVKHDKQVIQLEKFLIVDEVRVDDVNRGHFLSIKLPVYSDANAVIGVAGVSVLLGRQPLAESIGMFFEMGFVNLNNWIKQKKLVKNRSIINGVAITDRQLQIVNLVVRGLSAAKIGLETGLSKRTVEHYIEAIKIKLQVSSKAQLIQLALKDCEFD